jgi:hypothetical protein
MDIGDALGSRMEAWLVYTRGAGIPRARLSLAHLLAVGTWLSLVERTLGVGEVASSNLVVPTI